jgi:hydroxylamine reductase
MFCYQREQAAKGEGCLKIGVCGKQPNVSDLQDLTVYAMRGLALVAQKARKTGNRQQEADEYIPKTLFSTLTNVNFDPGFFVKAIHEICLGQDRRTPQMGDTGTLFLC